MKGHRAGVTERRSDATAVRASGYQAPLAPLLQFYTLSAAGPCPIAAAVG